MAREGENAAVGRDTSGKALLQLIRSGVLCPVKSCSRWVEIKIPVYRFTCC